MTQNNIYELEVKLSIEPIEQSIHAKEKQYPELNNPELIHQITLPQPIQTLTKEISFTDFQYQQDIYWDNPCIRIKDQGAVLRKRMIHFYTQKNNSSWSEQKKQNFVTYKGPKQKSQYKFREEIEFAVSDKIWTILSRLDFQIQDSVEKARWTAKETVSFDSMRIPVSLTIDIVQNLGLFMEVEIVLDNEKRKLFDSETIISKILNDYGLNTYKIEPLSYLALIQQRKQK